MNKEGYKVSGIPILTPSEIKDWDSYTVIQEGIESHMLMERAAAQCSLWIQSTFSDLNAHFVIFCGPGNNGGDGLAISRQLIQLGYQVTTLVIHPKLGNRDFQINLQRLQNINHEVLEWDSTTKINLTQPNKTHFIAIDAVLGIGLNKPIQGKYSEVIQYINQNFNQIISIDIPSGLFANEPSAISNNLNIVKANQTLTFQALKLALLAPENDIYFGEIILIDIKLSPTFLNQYNGTKHPTFITSQTINDIYKKPNKFSHKGDNGHAILIGGSFGKFGAISLATKAALHSGAGLISVLAPGLAFHTLQLAIPEAMLITPETDQNNWLLETQINQFLPLPSNTSAVGIGPGLGKSTETKKALLHFLKTATLPLVLDADALNIVAAENALHLIPKSSILTPHPKEFERLFGKSNNSFERWEKLSKRAKQYKCTILLKGHHTAIATPNGELFFNSTGNPGMATGGSGDVLTGILVACLAKGYTPIETAILGVYIHGLAADIATTKEFSQESLSASGIIQHLGAAFKQVYSNQ